MEDLFSGRLDSSTAYQPFCPVPTSPSRVLFVTRVVPEFLSSLELSLYLLVPDRLLCTMTQEFSVFPLLLDLAQLLP